MPSRLSLVLGVAALLGGPSSVGAAEDAAPAETAPAAGTPPAEPAPTPGGDAEPAPRDPAAPAPTTSSPDSAPRLGRHRLAVSARYAHRLGDAGSAVGPADGYGVAGAYEFSYALVAPLFELSVGGDFSSDRFASTEQGISTDTGAAVPYGSTRVIQESAFILTHTVALRAGPVRPFFTLGAGLGIGYLQSVAPAYAPGSLRDTQLLGRASIGLDVAVSRIWSASLRADYTVVRGADRLTTTAGASLPVFGDLLDVNLALVYRF